MSGASPELNSLISAHERDISSNCRTNILFNSRLRPPRFDTETPLQLKAILIGETNEYCEVICSI